MNAIFEYELIIKVTPDVVLKVLPKVVLTLTKRHDFEFIGLNTCNGQIVLAIKTTAPTIKRITHLLQNIIEVEDVVFEYVT